MSNYPDYMVNEFDIVVALIGGCTKIGNEYILPEGKTLPSKEEIDAKRKELQADYDSKKYQRDRAASYPSLAEQFDLLYHDMTAGKGDKTGEWYKAVNKVKTDNPKPE